MVKKFVSLILVIFFGSVFVQAQTRQVIPSPEVFTSCSIRGNGVNVRAEPTTDSEVVYVHSTGFLYGFGLTENGWYAVSDYTDNFVGYISQEVANAPEDCPKQGEYTDEYPHSLNILEDSLYFEVWYLNGRELEFEIFLYEGEVFSLRNFSQAQTSIRLSYRRQMLVEESGLYPQVELLVAETGTYVVRVQSEDISLGNSLAFTVNNFAGNPDRMSDPGCLMTFNHALTEFSVSQGNTIILTEEISDQDIWVQIPTGVLFEGEYTLSITLTGETEISFALDYPSCEIE